jgi:hypothetical protein
MKIYENFGGNTDGHIECGEVLTGFKICEKFPDSVTDDQLLK